MREFLTVERVGRVGVVKLNRPELLNAWHRPMRAELVGAFLDYEVDPEIGAIVLTGSGSRAFSAGQDFQEAMLFDADRAKEWVGEWEQLYDTIRSLSKPLVAALNGVAVGSAFQVALLADFRVGHSEVRMGQPEINAGIASTTGPWIMREIIGLARTIDLTLSGRLMSARECEALGLINRMVAKEQVLDEAVRLAADLAEKPPIAMRLNKQRFREMTQEGFIDCLEAGVRIQSESYASGEPARMMALFFEDRAGRDSGAQRDGEPL